MCVFLFNFSYYYYVHFCSWLQLAEERRGELPGRIDRRRATPEVALCATSSRDAAHEVALSILYTLTYRPREISLTPIYTVLTRPSHKQSLYPFRMYVLSSPTFYTTYDDIFQLSCCCFQYTAVVVRTFDKTISAWCFLLNDIFWETHTSKKKKSFED